MPKPSSKKADNSLPFSGPAANTLLFASSLDELKNPKQISATEFADNNGFTWLENPTDITSSLPRPIKPDKYKKIVTLPFSSDLILYQIEENTIILFSNKLFEPGDVVCVIYGEIMPYAEKNNFNIQELPDSRHVLDSDTHRNIGAFLTKLPDAKFLTDFAVDILDPISNKIDSSKILTGNVQLQILKYQNIYILGAVATHQIPSHTPIGLFSGIYYHETTKKLPYLLYKSSSNQWVKTNYRLEILKLIIKKGKKIYGTSIYSKKEFTEMVLTAIKSRSFIFIIHIEGKANERDFTLFFVASEAFISLHNHPLQTIEMDMERPFQIYPIVHCIKENINKTPESISTEIHANLFNMTKYKADILFNEHKYKDAYNLYNVVFSDLQKTFNEVSAENEEIFIDIYCKKIESYFKAFNKKIYPREDASLNQKNFFSHSHLKIIEDRIISFFEKNKITTEQGQSIAPSTNIQAKPG